VEDKIELLPCPFCGNTPWLSMGKTAVVCQIHGCPLKAQTFSVKEWNHRASKSEDFIGQIVTSNQQGKGEIASVIKECIALLQINLEYNRGSVSEKLNAVLAQLSPVA
jgi:hypothetical protein